MVLLVLAHGCCFGVHEPLFLTPGFGFISFLDPFDMVKAIKEMNGASTCRPIWRFFLVIQG